MMIADRGNNFDLIRLTFAGAVIFSHSFMVEGQADPVQAQCGVFSVGTLALAGFFIVSGALISESWRADSNLARYAARRLLRIVPAFLVATVISVYVVGWIGATDPTHYLADLGWRWIPGAFLLLEPFTPPAFAGSAWPIVNGSMWTIDFEVACYALTPALMAVWRTPWVYVAAWVAMAIEGLIWPEGDVIRLFFMFLSGALIAQAELPRIRVWQAGLVLAVAFVLPPLCYVLFATAGAWLILRFGRAAAIMRLKMDISYGVYLYGWPVGKVLSWEGVTNPWLLFALTLPLAAGLGWLSWRCIERPFLRLKPGAREVTAVDQGYGTILVTPSKTAATSARRN